MACENCKHPASMHHAITATYDVCDGRTDGGRCPCDDYSEDYAEEMAAEAEGDD